MAGRPSNRVEIGMVEFLRLGFLMLACHEAEYDIGDCNLVQGAPEMFSDISKHSKITLTLEQLDSLIYHYKQAVMYRFSMACSIKSTPTEYQSLMKKIQAVLPNHVRRNKYGELVLVGFNHKYDASRARRDAFRRKLKASEMEPLKLPNT